MKHTMPCKRINHVTMDVPSITYLTNHWITGLTDITYLKQQLEYAEKQLMIADDMYSKLTWGNRCDALEAALLDAEAV